MVFDPIAEQIAVFVNEEIVEYGSNKELLNKNGVYAEMFNRQSQPYIFSDAIDI